MNESFDLKRFVSYLFIAGIAVLFAVQWGPGSVGCGKGRGDRRGDSAASEAESAATVNGKEVPLKDFSRAYLGQLSRFKSQGLTAQLAKQLGIHNQVLEQLINTEVLAQAAEARGIMASDAEIIDVLKRNPEFQKDGKFDINTYKNVMAQYYRRTPEDFEAEVRRQLSAQKLLDLVEQGAVVSEDEVKARYLKEANKANLTFVKFSATQFADKVPAPKSTELDAWSAAHQADIAAYYEKNKASYFQDTRAHVRQILVRASKDDGEARRAEAKTKAEGLLKEIQGGKDFAEVAKASSDDTETKAKGGDLGFVERFALPSGLADAVFRAKAGDLTPVIESPIGFHIAKVEEVKAPETRPLDAVKKEIAETVWKRDKATELARAEAQKALTAAKSGKKLTDLYPKDEKDAAAGQFAAPTKPVATETGDINRGATTLPQLGASPEITNAVFALTAPAVLDQVFAVGGDPVVVQVTERSKPSDDDFVKQKEQMTTEAIKGKQFELREAFVKSLRKQATVTQNNQAIDRVTEG
ncbi:MAG: SurA N-terminal domain-containing protein [Archangiaceae bacterium]|nr:SurA N-terminal domain-containing protein [Archangiaceae bacterium]